MTKFDRIALTTGIALEVATASAFAITQPEQAWLFCRIFAAVAVGMFRFVTGG